MISLPWLRNPKDSFDEIKAAWHDTPIVATTCLGIGHPLFNERTFDYCIVDEASQITLPHPSSGRSAWPARLFSSETTIQLPPLVQNEEARVGGLDVSLFKLLSDTHPESVVNLEHQYRMCEDIMTLSNTLIYNGRLKCGTENLRFASLQNSPACLTYKISILTRLRSFIPVRHDKHLPGPAAGPVLAARPSRSRGPRTLRVYLTPSLAHARKPRGTAL